MAGYNHGSFSPGNYDYQSEGGPEVGQMAPDFELETHDGEKLRLLKFEGDCLLLEIGSMTCPLFLTRRESMNKLSEDFPHVTSVVLYVREAYPGKLIPAHANLEEKKACASLLKSELNDTRTILVDDVEGCAHLAYGRMPNAVYIIDKDGVVRFKLPWNNTRVTRKALLAVLKGEEAKFKSYFKPAKPWVAINTFRRAGAGSAAEFFKSLPTLTWNILVKNNIRTFFSSL